MSTMRLLTVIGILAGLCVHTHAGGFLIGTPTSLGRPVNSSMSDFGAAVSPDGRSLFFNRGTTCWCDADIYVSERSSVDDQWGTPKKLGPNINSRAMEGVPSISADGLSLYFSDGLAYQGIYRPGGSGGRDLWVSTRDTVDSPWNEAENLGALVNSRYTDADVSISDDGLSLFFASNRPGGSGALDIWFTTRDATDVAWEEPQNLGVSFNNGAHDYTPEISPDGLSLIFASERSPNRGSFGDLWITTRDTIGAPWKEPVRLDSTINTTAGENSPRFSADGSTLYYSSWGSQGYDIFSVPVLPLESVPLTPGPDGYSQDFDEALGVDGAKRGISFPTGWTVTDNEIFFQNETNRQFPVDTSIGRSTPVAMNAGAQNDPDRALAVGVPSNSAPQILQLLAEVDESAAAGLQLQFDIEAWDAARVTSLGEGAFDVTVDVDTGDGFAPLADLGRVSTGVNLFPPAGEYLDGNAEANRVSFDSGIVEANLPEGSTLRVRWAAAPDGQTENWVFGLDNVTLSLLASEVEPALLAGDADQDLDFDQFDLIRVQQSAKYLTGEPATWGQGDWNGAPGGRPGEPPTGDGIFNQFDIIAAQQGAAYLTGPYVAIQAGGTSGDGQASIGYDAGSGEIRVDAPAGNELTSINIDSASGIFTREDATNLGGSFDNDADANIFKATFGGSFGSVSFGNVAQTGLSQEFVLGDLTVIGSLAGGGDLGNVDLVYVPEPASALLLALGLVIGLARIRSGRH